MYFSICTQHDFLCSKVRFIHTSTVTELHSCSEKNTRTPRVHFVDNDINFIVFTILLVNDYGAMMVI